MMRDRSLEANWLEDFSRAAGGQRIGVPVGGGNYAFDRVLRETSAYTCSAWSRATPIATACRTS